MSFSRVLVAAAACASAFLFTFPSRAVAQDTSEAQVWVQFLAIGQLSEKWRSHIEVQPRFMDDASELGLTLVRTAIGRQIHPRVSIWAGHVWVPRTLGPGVQHEQRIWQQLLVTSPAMKRWVTTGRFRLEQRWLDPWENNAHRFRALVRAQRPLDSDGTWSIAAYDEAFFTLDGTGLGPPRGYDRNRVYTGLVRRLSAQVSIEGGYIWENSTIRGSLRRNDHVAIAVINLASPRRQ